MARKKIIPLGETTQTALCGLILAMHLGEKNRSGLKLADWFEQFWLPPVIRLNPSDEDDKGRATMKVELCDQFDRIVYVCINLRDMIGNEHLGVDSIVINNVATGASFRLSGHDLSSGIFSPEILKSSAA